ncbi:MAG: phage tail tape measure protein, partial [Spirochaetia bacterium]|nr:phage tail tape measure protein [Spirochaetia bacterium]
MSFTAKITADITKFEQNIDKAVDSTNKLDRTVSAKLSNIGDSFIGVGKKASIFSAAVGAAAVAAVAFAKKTGDMANDLLSATIALDSSADILQEYKLVSIEAGTSTDAFSRSVESLTRRLKEAEGDGDDVTEYIQRLGVSLFDSSGEMRRMGDITDDLIKSLAGMENTAQRNIIASQLFGRQWVSIAPILALGADGIDEVRRNAHDLGVVLDGDALNAANKFSIEMNKMQLQLQAVKDRLASEIAPVLSETLVPILEDKVVPAIGSMAEGLGDIADKFNNLPDQTKEVILAIGSIAVAIGPVLLGIGAILKTLPLIAAGFAAITGPIGLAIGAIVTMIANIPRVLRNVVEGFKLFAENIKMIFKALFSLLKGDVDSFFDGFTKQFGKNIGWAKDQIDGLRDKWNKLKGFLGFGGGEDVVPAWYTANEMTGSAGAMQEVATSAA